MWLLDKMTRMYVLVRAHECATFVHIFHRKSWIVLGTACSNSKRLLHHVIIHRLVIHIPCGCGYTCMFLQGEGNLPCILQWRILIYITIFVLTTTCSRKTQTYPFILLVHQLFSSTAWGYKNFILGNRILEIKLMDTFVGNSYENCLSSLSFFV